jgi:hypothetical protein
MSDITRTELLSHSSESNFGVSTAEVSSSDRVTIGEVQGVRMDLVNRIKAQIAAGTYETPEKLQIALDRMIGRVEETM